MELLIKNEDCSPGLCDSIAAASAGARLRQSLSGTNSKTMRDAKHTFLPPTRVKRVGVTRRRKTAIALASGAEAGLSSLSLASTDAGLLSSPVFWSVSVMLTIVGLLRTL